MAEDTRAKLQSIPALTGRTLDLSGRQFPADPVQLFLDWLDEALEAEVPEPRTMTLSTVDAQGIPDARALILKDVDTQGWAFASEASSSKGTQLAANPAAALSFWWQPLTRAIRVRGPVIEASREESEADLAARSPQAQANVARDDWTLWRVVPTRIEFWQGSPDREHQRLIYSDDAGTWSISQNF